MRDMTHLQFQRALKKHRIKQIAAWFIHPAKPNLWISGLFYRDGRCDRRQTLAKILKKARS